MKNQYYPTIADKMVGRQEQKIQKTLSQKKKERAKLLETSEKKSAKSEEIIQGNKQKFDHRKKEIVAAEVD